MGLLIDNMSRFSQNQSNNIMEYLIKHSFSTSNVKNSKNTNQEPLIEHSSNQTTSNVDSVDFPNLSLQEENTIAPNFSNENSEKPKENNLRNNINFKFF